MKQNILIMTSTIRPPADSPGMVRLNPALRLGDYKSALRFYVQQLGNGIDQILFVENSGSDLSELRELVAKSGAEASVYFHGYHGFTYPQIYGRCYGELRSLDEVMSTRIVASLPENTLFWKVTGRYKVINLQKMIRTCPADLDFYCDMRTTSRLPWFDMRFVAWTRRGYEAVLRGVFDEVREDEHQFRPGEETAFHVIKPRLMKIRSKTYWVREPFIEGIRAFDEKNWNRGRQLVVYWLRHLQRRIIGQPIF